MYFPTDVYSELLICMKNYLNQKQLSVLHHRPPRSQRRNSDLSLDNPASDV